MTTSMPMPTPAFIVDEIRLRNNLELLSSIKARTGCRILLAQKGFAMWHFYPLIRRYLDGVCASSPWEARLGREQFNREVHTFAAAYSRADIQQLMQYTDEIDFNSFAQWHRFRPVLQSINRPIRCGLRINPQCSTQDHAIYDPCAPGSRLGIRAEDFIGQSLEGISGLHFHTLCEQNADALQTTLQAVEKKFGSYLHTMDWLNFGGGHHITRSDYDIDLLCDLIITIQQRYNLQVYLEPGEAVALNTGILLSTVLDIVHNEHDIAILDTSCTAHMPDVMEMPYRPHVAKRTGSFLFPSPAQRAGTPGEKPFTYQLTGCSCLAGDLIGTYSFATPLQPGDQLIFEDMAHYTMVKTTFFNGIQHPDLIACNTEENTHQLIRHFTYDDYKNRLS